MRLSASVPRTPVLLPAIVASVAALVATSAAQARDIHYGAVSDARLGQCDTAEWQGKQADARTCYRSVLQASPDPAIRAEAMWALGDLKSANDLFKQAAAAQPKNSRVRARWAENETDRPRMIALTANALKGDEAQFVINRSGRIVRAAPKADGG